MRRVGHSVQPRFWPWWVTDHSSITICQRRDVGWLAMSDLAPGLYEHPVTRELERRLGLLDGDLVDLRQIEPADAHEVLTRHLAGLTRRALQSVPGSDTKSLKRQVELANGIAKAIEQLAPEAVGGEDRLKDGADVLMAIAGDRTPTGDAVFAQRPEIPLRDSALLVNGRGQPRIGHEIARELASADHVDLLCAFIKWYGLRTIEKEIAEFIARGGQLRVITTTYVGATERRALDRLHELGAKIKVSYETRTTRLHAKAWLFHRNTGLSTAYVGSSNLSKSALIDGLEWNVRLAGTEQPHLLDTFAATFDEYWADPEFEEYDPERDWERLDKALSEERGDSDAEGDLDVQIAPFDIRPYGYQSEILEELAAEREVHGRWHSLVVMATGTGKTVVSALDYRRLREAGYDSLLFIAHRDEILRQSRATFCQVLRDGTFGEEYVGGRRPVKWTHVFGSVQSLANLELENLDPRRFDVVVVDEFHHAAASTYARLLNHLKPKVLIGLTATPERADGQDIKHWFDDQIAVELRLWEALERNLLCPFQYFGLYDGTDLSGVQWKRGQGYDQRELTNLYTGDDQRVALVLQALKDKIVDVGRMRALGFCVSIDHATYMARCFNEAGIPARAVTSSPESADRRVALADLRARKINAIFTVDLFNEGIDVPAIDTVLFLRPTDNATVFLQQLGRGLRLDDDKPCLTVLDFIGNQHKKFRFDRRYRALTGVSRRELEAEIKEDFPLLPPGCHIDLDHEVSRLVLENVRKALHVQWPDLAAELRLLGDISLPEFLTETGLELGDLYRGTRRGWVSLRRASGREVRPESPIDDALGRAYGRMLHVDDLERLTFLRELLREPYPPSPGLTRERRLFAMLHALLWGGTERESLIEEKLQDLWSDHVRREELIQIADVLHGRIRRVTPTLDESSPIPVHLHARYSKNEALAAFGVDRPAHMREGVKWIEQHRADLFFVTIDKSEDAYKPTTMYHDRAITPELFQWESQSVLRESMPTAQRYINHVDRGTTVHLFLRKLKKDEGWGAPPYLYAGPMIYHDHQGERPIRFLWQLEHALPADVFHDSKVTAG
jgi:superfamily II DNA or RNA helicase/HKD family nuclease